MKVKETSPSGEPGLVLMTAYYVLLLYDLYLDPTITDLAFQGFIVCHWSGQTITNRGKTGGIDTLGNKVFPNRFGSAFGKAEVIFSSTDIAGMTGDLDFDLGVVEQGQYDLVKDRH